MDGHNLNAFAFALHATLTRDLTACACDRDRDNFPLPVTNTHTQKPQNGIQTQPVKRCESLDLIKPESCACIGSAILKIMKY